MDKINLESLFASFVRRYSIGANSLARFKASFLSAYNSAIMDLYNWNALSEEPEMVTDTDGESILEVKYLPILNTGIGHFLQKESEWVKGEARDEYSELNWIRAKGNACSIKIDAIEAAGNFGPWGTNE